MITTNATYSLITLLLWSAWAGQTRADVFEYAKQVHVGSVAECESEVKSLADRVATLTDGTVQNMYCAQAFPGHFEGSVFIDAPQIPHVELAVGAFMINPAPGHNPAINRGYVILDPEVGSRDLSQCLNQLPQMEAIFTAQTGLDVVSSQCIKEANFHFIPQVDGFGTAHKELRDLSVHLYDAIADDNALSAIRQYLESQGGAVLMDTTSSSYVMARYYAKSPIYMGAFDFHQHNAFSTKEQCNDSLNVANTAIRKRSDLKHVTSICLEGLWSGGQKRFIMLAVFDSSPRENIDVNIPVKNIGRFQTLEACKTAQQRSPETDFCSGAFDVYGRLVGLNLNRIN